MNNPDDPLFQPPSLYPDFQANQVLSADDLNLLGSYLYGQTRWTRLSLIGVGPVCGLVPRWDKTSDRLVISAGYGVTSHGYLIYLGQSELTHYKETVLPGIELFGEVAKDQKYQAYELLELKDDDPKTDKNVTRLKQDFADSKVGLVRLQPVDDPAGGETCKTDCDETGKHQSYEVGKFLVDQDVADQLLARSYQNDINADWTISGLLIGKYSLDDLHLERFGYPFDDYLDIDTVTGYQLRFAEVATNDNLDELTRGEDSLVLVALVGGETLHIRILDAVGETLVDKGGADLSQDRLVSKLSDLLKAHPDALRLDKAERLEVKRYAASVSAETQPVYAKIKTYEAFKTLYQEAIDRGVERVLQALKNAHRLFSPLFTRIDSRPLLAAAKPGEPARMDEPAFRKRFATGESDPLLIQYLYDHLLDLVLAHNELRAVAFDLMDACVGVAGLFPNHLLLGTVDTSEQVTTKSGKSLVDIIEPLILSSICRTPSIYRTPYTQPPLYNGNASRVGTAALLFKRLELLVNRFPEPGEFPVREDSGTEVRITPSRWGNARLSERAIPYYYSDPQELRDAWNGDRCRMGKLQQTLGYHFQRTQPVLDEQDPDVRHKDPLVFDFEGNDFFRIEGHIGMEKKHALQRITKLQNRYNLPFDIVVLRLDENDATADLQDCEIAVFQSQYTKLRTDLACALKEADLSKDEDVKDLLKKLEEWDKLDDFVYADNFETAFDKAASRHGSGECLLGCDKAAFRDLHQFYTERKEAMKGQGLFHEFALKHPGIEHKAGVPRGGTFILVYREAESVAGESGMAEGAVEQLASETTQSLLKERIDREVRGLGDKPAATTLRNLMARKFDRFRLSQEFQELGKSIHSAFMAEMNKVRQIVVGDFCLPYLCCSSCPPNAYVFVKPRPILLLVPVVFCKNDDHRYLFIVDPVGGRLSSDAGGVEQEGDRFFFVPNDTTIPEGRVRVTYTVDGVESQLLLHILPEADAGFHGLEGPYCSNVQPVELEADSETVESRFKGNGVTGNYFDPGAVDFGNDDVDEIEVTVIHEVIDEITGCLGSSDQIFTVLRAPQATFKKIPGHICLDPDREDQRIPLLPAEGTPAGGEFTSSVGAGIVSGPDGQVFFDPRADGVPLSTPIEIRYSVTANGCTGFSTQTTRVIDAAFEGLKDEYDAGGDPSILTPARPDGVIGQFLVDGKQIPNNRFFPGDVSIPEEQCQVEVPVTHRVSIDGGTCEHSRQTRVLLHPPSSSFQARLVDQNESHFQFEITHIEPSLENERYVYLFFWHSVEQEPSQPTPQMGEGKIDGDRILLPIPRSHLEKGQVFTLTLVVKCRDAERKGTPSKQEVIVAFEPDQPSEPDTPTDDRVAELLLSRSDRYLEATGRIAEENAGISRATAYKRADSFLKASFDRPSADLIDDYTELVPTLVSARNRARPDRKGAYGALAQTATLAFWDRIATRTLTDEDRDRAKVQLAKLEDAGIDLGNLYETAWLTEDLQGALDSARIERVRSLIE